MKKNKIREKYLLIRQQKSLQEKEIQSEKIVKQLISLVKEFDCIGLFAGTMQEPNITELLNIYPDKKLCFPKVTDAENGKMEFYEVQSLSDLEKGFCGILEPKNHCIKISATEIEAFCIPAVSIDSDGNRLGMGGGFYDRYLERVRLDSKKIGVIFPWQFSSEIFESDTWDIPINMVVGAEKINIKVFKS